MKLQIKTLNRKTLMVEMNETKNVYDLKKELSLYPDVAVEPEFQKLIFSGKVLKNNAVLQNCNIDIGKALVLMILKQPEIEVEEEEPVEEIKTEETSSTNIVTEQATIDGNVGDDSKQEEPTNRVEQLVQEIMSMGYDEASVRAAMAAAYNHAEAAVGLLADGRLPNGSVEVVGSNIENDSYTDELFGPGSLVHGIRKCLSRNPEFIKEAIASLAQTNPSLLEMIDENHEEFLRLLMQSFQESDDDSDNE